MPNWVNEALGKHSLAWLVIIIIVLMVGPTGIERAFDRFFPQAVNETVAIDLLKIERKSGRIENVIQNQKILLRQMLRMIEGMSRVSDDVDTLDMRVTGLEAWRVFQDPSVKGEPP